MVEKEVWYPAVSPRNCWSIMLRIHFHSIGHHRALCASPTGTCGHLGLVQIWEFAHLTSNGTLPKFHSQNGVWEWDLLYNVFPSTCNFGCNSGNLVSQSDGRIQILLQFDWMAQFSLLQPDVARTWKDAALLFSTHGPGQDWGLEMRHGSLWVSALCTVCQSKTCRPTTKPLYNTPCWLIGRQLG